MTSIASVHRPRFGTTDVESTPRIASQNGDHTTAPSVRLLQDDVDRWTRVGRKLGLSLKELGEPKNQGNPEVLKRALPDIVGSVTDFVNALKHNADDTLKKAVESLRTFGQKLTGGVAAALNNVKEASHAQDVLKHIDENATDFHPELRAKLVEVVDSKRAQKSIETAANLLAEFESLPNLVAHKDSGFKG